MSITPRTGKQVKAYQRLAEAAANHGSELALDKVDADLEGWQRVLEHGDELLEAVAEVYVTKTRELSVGNCYAHQQVASNFDYSPGYIANEVSRQIDLIRGPWPMINPDGAWKYATEVLPKLPKPAKAEAPYVIIRQGFFSEQYIEAVAEVLKVLAAMDGGLENYLKKYMSATYLQQCSRTLRLLAAVGEQQPGDLHVLYGQFGKKHAGESVLRAREIFPAREIGFGIFQGGAMLVGNPGRLVSFDDLWMDFPGDEFRAKASGPFGRAPCLHFRGDRCKLLAHEVGDFHVHFGSVSGFLSQPQSLDALNARVFRSFRSI